MVVTARSRTAPTGSMQDRTGLPSICTVQAPHWAMPQPNFVPVMPRMSRRPQSRGMSGGASNDFGSPLIVRVVAIRTSNPAFTGRNVRPTLEKGPIEAMEQLYPRMTHQENGTIFFNADLYCRRSPRYCARDAADSAGRP